MFFLPFCYSHIYTSTHQTMLGVFWVLGVRGNTEMAFGATCMIGNPLPLNYILSCRNLKRGIHIAD